MSEPVLVEKLNLAGQVIIAWHGQVITRTATSLVLEARFAHGPLALGYVTLKPGDRFVEHFYSDRWYNIYAIYAADDGAFKGWYCNITRPAEIAPAPDGQGWRVRAVDLALDYFRRPDGQEYVLDEEEFEALPLTAGERAACRAALSELRQRRWDSEQR